MKKQVFLSVLAIIATVSTLFAQTGAPEQKAPNARAKETVLKLQADLGITNEQLASAYKVFEDFYTAQQNAMEELRSNGGDRAAMKAKRDELVDARDAKLKTILTEAQMKKWKENIEPSMRPQRKSE
ncbi:hypothetical protein ACFOWM_09710 [Ferruginibacter yonginensis]|uniref:LTXXQ motif family protein n=1 Tax=Ferruginibacter yonginensis TaxID=1310416 RepID=A0ABV8QST0_9BACT